MGQSRPAHTLHALVAASFLLIASAAGAQDPPDVPVLTQAELRCQTAINDSTRAYVEAVFVARQACFNGQMGGTVDLAADCTANTAMNESTGDPETDAALDVARGRLLSDVPASCAGVDLTELDFPGFCTNAPPDRPFDIFDLTDCLLSESDEVSEILIDVEQPPVEDILNFGDRKCRNEVSRKASIMFTGELDARQTCLLKQIRRRIPETVDCRLEDDALAPGTGDTGTDNGIVSAHNRNLRGISNACRPVFLTNVGFPNMCPEPSGNVYPLSALRDCMFSTHHFDIIRFLDIMNPATTKCGNGSLDFAEQCDDGDNTTTPGELCMFNCTVNSNCGDPTGTGGVTVIDALFILKASVGLESCALSLCDVNGDGFITASDARRVLLDSIGINVPFLCPAPISFTCGNGIVDMFEECDDGDAMWTLGEQCNASCLRLGCSDPNDSGTITTTDVVLILQASTGQRSCDLSVCDVDGNGSITPTDATIALNIANGLGGALNCPF